MKKDISSFIVKVRKENDPDKKKLEILERHCKKYNIPLIQIPENMHYWGIIQYVMTQVFDRDVARLKYFKITHDNFNTLALQNNDSPNKSKDIIEFLGTMIENPIALYYSNGNCFASTNGEESKLVLSEERKPYRPDIVTKFQYLKQKMNGYDQYIVKIDIINEVECYLAITEKDNKLTDLDYMAVENAIINLQYSFVSEFAQNEIRKKYQRDFIHNILNGLLKSKEMEAAAATLGLKKEDFYRVVEFHTIAKNSEGKYTEEQLHEVGVIEGELVHLLPKAHIYRNMDQIVMIQKVQSDQTEMEYQEEMEEIREIIEKSIRHRKKDTDFQIGIGKCVKGYEALKESYREAQKAIKYIDIVRIVSGDKEKSVLHYSNLGFFQIFGNAKAEELLNYIPETLKRLYRHDQEHKGELILTLQTFLDNNQSLKKTSQNLFVHYRTVSYRLGKIEEISGMNFENPNEMLAVRNGLIIYKMLNC